MPIRFTTFNGMLPARAPQLLPAEMSQAALNCDFTAGDLRAMHDATLIASLPDSARLTIYPYNGNWLSWITDVDIVKSPVAEDAYQRIYITGDGLPKIRGVDGGIEKEFTLGIPAPTAAPTIAVVTKTATTWTREWHYFWEESDGSQKDAGTLTEGGGILSTEAGKVYTVPDISALSKPTASGGAKFVLWFDAYTAAGVLMGRVYPQHSIYRNSTSLMIDGATVTGDQVNDAAAVITLTYTTGDNATYASDRTYAYSFVSAWGEEGALSAPSLLGTVDPGKDILLTNLETSVPAGYGNVTRKRIYRSVTASSGTTEYQYVPLGTADEQLYGLMLNVASVTDNVDDADCGEVAPSADWLTPPDDLQGIQACAGGFLVGFHGKEVCFSEPWQPHAWPLRYRRSVFNDIVGIGVGGNSILIVTTAIPEIATGATPDAITMGKLAVQQACASKRSIFTVGGAVGYACPDGIELIDGATPALATMNYYTREQWQALVPSSMICAIHDGLLHIACTDIDGEPRELVFRVTGEGSVLTETDEAVTGYYNDPDDDTLYFIDGTEIKSWNTAATAKTATRMSKLFIYERPVTWGACRVIASAYPVTLNLYANGVLVVTAIVASEYAMRLPQMVPARKWEIESIAAADISEIVIGTGMADLDGK